MNVSLLNSIRHAILFSSQLISVFNKCEYFTIVIFVPSGATGKIPEKMERFLSLAETQMNLKHNHRVPSFDSIHPICCN